MLDEKEKIFFERTQRAKRENDKAEMKNDNLPPPSISQSEIGTTFWGHLEFDKLLKYIKEHCHSLPGVEFLDTFSPSTDKDFIVHRLNLINDIQKIIFHLGDLKFNGLSDVKIIFDEIKSLTFNFEEIKAIITSVKIGNNVISSNKLQVTSYKLNGDICYPDTQDCFGSKASMNLAMTDGVAYQNFTESLVAYPIFEKRFHQIFDEEGNVLDTASTELRSIRQRIRKLKERIQSELHKTLNDVQLNSFLQDKIITQRNDRFVVPVKEGFASNFEGISHGRSGSGASVYMEPKSVVPLNNEVNDLVSAEKEEIYKIFCEFTKQLRGEEEGIVLNFEILKKLDTYFACGRVSLELQAIVPEIVEENLIELKRARHPLLIIKFQSVQKVIPFNLVLGKDYNILLISGPNTGGKTITLKTIGLCTLMALTGLPIPADYGSKIGLLSNVFADIGDNQSIDNSLSTFSGHIHNIKQIVESGSENTLVLIDEIGSATDPEQGVALAQAILEDIIAKGALAVITTHYTSLKVFVENTQRCVNASMQFDPEKHEPTYQFMLGFPGNSFAIEIASKLGLDNELVKRAKELTGTQNVELTELLMKMNEEKRKLSVNNYQFELKNRLLEIKTAELETKLKEFETNKKKRIKESIADTQSFLTGIQKRINEQLTEIKNLDKIEKKKKLNDLTKEIQEERVRSSEYGVQSSEFGIQSSELRVLNSELRTQNSELEIGNLVWIASFETEAIIMEKKKSGYKVDMNGIIFSVKAEDVFKLDDLKASPHSASYMGEAKPEISTTGYVSHNTIEYSGKAKLELNLLGKNFEESLPLIQDLIDNALFCGLTKVRIVHGRGTGILRQKIRAYLKKNDKVQEFYSPPQEAGGDGVTVVSL